MDDEEEDVDEDDDKDVAQEQGYEPAFTGTEWTTVGKKIVFHGDASHGKPEEKREDKCVPEIIVQDLLAPCLSPDAPSTCFEATVPESTTPKLLGKRPRDHCKLSDYTWSDMLDQKLVEDFASKRTAPCEPVPKKWTCNFRPTFAQSRSTPVAPESYLGKPSQIGSTISSRRSAKEQKDTNCLASLHSPLAGVTKSTTDPSKVLQKAAQLASKYDGECLSLNTRLSIVKGSQALKFKCQQGHVFYRFVDEINSCSFGFRKASAATMASSDEESSPLSEPWCHKCEAFYRSL